MNIIRRDELVDIVRNLVLEGPAAGYMKHLVDEKLAGFPVYLRGGAVRDAFVRAGYGRELEINDYDIVYDDVDNPTAAVDLFNRTKGVYPKSHGNVFWRPEWMPGDETTIDVIALSSYGFNHEGSSNAQRIRPVLEAADLTTSSAAYSFSDDVIYDNLFLPHFMLREVELQNEVDYSARHLMTRMVLHSEKLGFKIGEKGIDYILRNYGTGMNLPILGYLDERGMAYEYDGVIGKLKEIAGR